MTKQEFEKQYDIDVSNERIGGGGFGDVYKAYDNINDIYKAIKIAPVKFIGNKKFSLIQEFAATKDLVAHKNIANYEAVYQFESYNGIFDFAVMQYYPLGNLKELLANHKLSTTQKIQIAEGLINGINFLHQHRIIHRDIKPSNILVSKRHDVYTPKIADFGLSKFYDNEFESISNSVGAGTLEYSSPEQLKGLKLKPNTDLWSLGVLIYELFSGRIPFETDTATGHSANRRLKILENIGSKKTITGIDNCPYPYNQIVRLSLVHDPDERVESAQMLVDLIAQSKREASNSTGSNPNIYKTPGDTDIVTKEELEVLINAERIQQEKQDKFDKQVAQGDAYFKIHNYNKAITAYQQAAEIFPDQPNLSIKITECRRLIEKEEADRRYKTNKEKYDSLIAQASQSFKDGNFTKALSHLETANTHLSLEGEGLQLYNLTNKAIRDAKAEAEAKIKQEEEARIKRKEEQRARELAIAEENRKQEAERKAIAAEEAKRKREAKIKAQELAKAKEQKKRLEEQKAIAESKRKAEIEKRKQEEKARAEEKERQLAEAERKRKAEILAAADAKKIVEQQREEEIAINKYLVKGDGYFDEEQWDNAIKSYRNVLSIAGRHTYAEAQIKKCKKKQRRIFFWFSGKSAASVIGVILLVVGSLCGIKYFNTDWAPKKGVTDIIEESSGAEATEIATIENSPEKKTISTTPINNIDDSNPQPKENRPATSTSPTNGNYPGSSEPSVVASATQSEEEEEEEEEILKTDQSSQTTTAQTPNQSNVLPESNEDDDSNSPSKDKNTVDHENEDIPTTANSEDITQEIETEVEEKEDEPIQQLPPVIAAINANIVYPINHNIGIGKYEVTQEEYSKLMGPINFENGEVPCSKCPVSNISYSEVLEYISKLNNQSKPYGLVYRLPTESEWEYYAKADQNYKYPGGSDPKRIALYSDTRDKIKSLTQKVTVTKANNYGIHGMAGNVAEWTSTEEVSKKKRKDKDKKMIAKGGSFYSKAYELEITERRSFYAAYGDETVGFRLICEKLDQ